ncbi:MAG: DNA methyltransferase [Planctomycetota bacterium]|nr:DNA methyltransferase [Planctomycetota bacterium]
MKPKPPPRSERQGPDDAPPLPRPVPASVAARKRTTHSRPPLTLQTTTLWEYPSQQYGDGTQGDQNYVGATPSWIIWQLLQRYTRENDLVVDPMCGSGTTIDVARDLKRRALGYDVAPRPSRPDIFRADARRLPLEDAKADFVFVDPPYSTHVEYSEDPRCIGKLDAGGDDAGKAYYDAMTLVTREIVRVLRPGRYMGLYVSDSFRKPRREDSTGFMPIGFELFGIMRDAGLRPVDIVCVARHNAKLHKGNWKRAAEEGNFFLRGFNYLFIMRKPAARPRSAPAPGDPR